MAQNSIFLCCDPGLDSVIRARMSYAFQVFAAIYGYRVTETISQAEISCAYGTADLKHSFRRLLRIPARYRARPAAAGMPVLEAVQYANEEIRLVHGLDSVTNQPDWLGEIFEWISSSLELPIRERDAAGRIPYSATVFHRQNISPQKPNAALLMAWMENALRNEKKTEQLLKATSPAAGVEHMVVCSHDLDYLHTSPAAAFRRIGKNLGIALANFRSTSFFISNFRMMLGLLRRNWPGEYLRPMLREIEELGFRSTLFAVAEGGHRRDPVYTLNRVGPQLREAEKRGFSVGLHASYASVVENNSLCSESEKLGNILGKKPRGNRQHWLRFDTHAKLIRAIESAQLAYDSSLGFAETCGFRNGASFAFPPYNFEKEKPCDFLEIPLAIMDGSLAASTLSQRTAPQELADEVLSESRRWGWGGIGILWHNPMEPIQVSEEVNRVFWECAQRRNEFAEQWMSADEFLAAALPRYQAAGLLKETNFHA